MTSRQQPQQQPVRAGQDEATNTTITTASRSWTLLAHNHYNDADGRGMTTPLFIQYTVKHAREERRMQSGPHYYYVLVKTDTTYDIEVLMPGPMRLYCDRIAFREQDTTGAWLVEELRWLGVVAASAPFCGGASC